MFKLKITGERLPTRCEVCHQADQYNAAQNFCARCSGLSVRAIPATKSEKTPAMPISPIRLLGNAIIFSLIAMTSTFWGISIGMALGAIINTLRSIEVLAMVLVIIGGIVGFGWGSLIGYRAVSGKYRAFYEIHT